ncbi:hypothetical protein [Streptomyces goshikiensis]|uniref:hypothetical protein n=1 Tax=Streptomyces goshikiensis TaxID=1942 RepID=UPI0036AF856F
MAALQASFPNMTMSLVGVSGLGSVRITAPTLADLIIQGPDLKDLHYLLIEYKANSTPQSDLLRVEFGSPEGVSRRQVFKGWFRRIQEWDVRVEAQSSNPQEAERLLASTMSVLRGHKISAARVQAFAVLPALSENLGLATLATLALFGFNPGNKAYASALTLALFSLFYWRTAFLIHPTRAYIILQTRPSLRSGLAGWSPSPRAQAVGTVIGGFAGLIALIVAILAWLAPRN